MSDFQVSPELLAIYLEDARQHLEALDHCLLTLEREGPDEETVAAVLGPLHTLKGNSGMIGFSGIKDYVHRLEDVFAHVRDGTLVLQPEAFDRLFAGATALRDSIEHSSREGTEGRDLVPERADLERMVARGPGAGSASRTAGLLVPPQAAASPQPAPAAPPPAAPAASALPTGQSAAATFFGLLNNPAVKQALLSQVFGGSGTPQVTTAAGTTVPRAAVNNLLMQLLANASEGLAEQEAAMDESYLQDASGEYLADPASFDQKAAVVLSRLQSESAVPFVVDSDDYFTSVEWMPDEAEEDQTEGIDDATETVSFY